MPSGRPKGVKESKPRNTAARKQADEMNASGISPLEILLTTMRDEWNAAESEEDEGRRLARRMVAAGIAERAAPYCHAKLANTTVNANVRRSIAEFTDEELAVIAGEDGDSEARARPH